MNWALFAVAPLLFLGSAVAYFHARFWIASVLGVAFWIVMVNVVLGGMGTAVAYVTLVPLCFGPALFFLVHAIDARTGTFIFPTAYSIPVAYLTGALLWVLGGIGLLV